MGLIWDALGMLWDSLGAFWDALVARWARYPKRVWDTLGALSLGTLAIDICLMFLMEAVSFYKIHRSQGAGLAWPVMARLGITIRLDFLARAGVVGFCNLMETVLPCWYAFLVEQRCRIIHLMEFQLEFLFVHMQFISFWYILPVEPPSCNLHEGTLVCF